MVQKCSICKGTDLVDMVGLTDGNAVHDHCCKEEVNVGGENERLIRNLSQKIEETKSRILKYKKTLFTKEYENTQRSITLQKKIDIEIITLDTIESELIELKNAKASIEGQLATLSEQFTHEIPFFEWITNLFKYSALFLLHPKGKWPNRVVVDEKAFLTKKEELERMLLSIKSDIYIKGLSQAKCKDALEKIQVIEINHDNELKEKIVNLETSLEELDTQRQQLYTQPSTKLQYRSDLTEYYDFWPVYPLEMDWWDRVAKVHRLQGGRCKKCNVMSPKGDVHHILELSLGGSNKLENLELLCKDCHQKQHTHKLKGKGHLEEIDASYDPKRQRIYEALRKHEEIMIRYVKDNGQITDKRTIKPIKFKRYKGWGKLGVYAHCNLRNARREFLLERIEEIY